MIETVLNPLKKLGILVLISLGAPLAAQDTVTAMSETDLRALVPFPADATLKMSECEKKSYPTCTYVWGSPDEDDATRIAMGGRPSGDKLMTIFAQAHNPQDFDRVLASYKDAAPVEGLGVTAVWSDMSKQLSLITEGNLVIHVNVDIWKLEDPRPIAEQVAAFLLTEQ